MGLDMYLYQKHYVQNWDHTPPEQRHEITILKGGKPSPIQTGKITYIYTEEIYWRKANAIHQWFVDNVQDGNDDCGRYPVTREQLQELLGLVTKVLEASELVEGKIELGQTYENGHWVSQREDGKCIKDPSVAKELLPTQDGFFFGGTEYNQYYYDDLQDTKRGLERLLSEGSDGEFEYHSSW